MTASTAAISVLLVLCLAGGCDYHYDEKSSSIVVEIADAEARAKYVEELTREGIAFKIVEGDVVEVQGVTAEELDRAMQPYFLWETERFQERRAKIRSSGAN